MAALIRALQPHDVFAYLAFKKRINRHDGVVALGHETVSSALGGLIAQGLLDPSRQRWVCRDGGQIVASLGVRSRPGVDMWEVDECSGLPTPAGRLGRLRLLNRLGDEAVEEGIQKIFMRVNEASVLEELAQQAGFGHYAVESVYVRPAEALSPPPRIPGLRPRRGADHHALFQLYTAVVPARVRQVEAMTLHEWRFIDGWRAARMRWAPGFDLMRRDVVVDREGMIVAWLQINRRRSLVRFLARPEFRPELPALLAWGVSAMAAPRGYICPLRDYQLDAELALVDVGFRLEARHSLLARLLAVRVQEPKLVPVHA